MEKLEEEVNVFKEMVEFMERISVKNDDDPVTMEDSNILSVACENVNGVHRHFCDNITSASAIDVSLIIKYCKSKVMKELNEVCDKLSNLSIKVDVQKVRADLDCTSDAHVSSSVWREDLTLMINNSRSQVENQLNVICNNVSNLTIKGDCSQHLVGFKEACLRLPMLPSRVNFLTSSCIFFFF
ncbi:14-3-3-like protein GF14 nu [Artemisia annua]|uniref:14-3-3-like protein GF14 nu n=1 Tax=Artemisia annua TaxID=35608 RepID=A0A2U1M8C7_ARTAN|nr:14-3-3-like protein GF14 nu [Artemisia annua]